MKHFYQTRTMLALALLALAPVLAVQNAGAYEFYDGCQTCHGEFARGDYTSASSKDGVAWNTDLMTGHINEMLGGSGCDVCHQSGSKQTVRIGFSLGTGGLPGIGCIGCHGRDDGSGPSGWGLREHHRTRGMSCSPCHDGDPATGPGEDAVPTYYANPGSFTTIPTHPCNTPAQSNAENFYGNFGLDNDGDNLYDGAEDNDCDVIMPTDPSTWGRIKALFE